MPVTAGTDGGTGDGGHPPAPALDQIIKACWNKTKFWKIPELQIKLSTGIEMQKNMPAFLKPNLIDLKRI